MPQLWAAVALTQDIQELRHGPNRVGNFCFLTSGADLAQCSTLGSEFVIKAMFRLGTNVATWRGHERTD